MSDIFVTLRGLLGKKNYTSESEHNFRVGSGGQMFGDHLHGKHYQAAKDGELYHAASTTVDGVAVLLNVEGTVWHGALSNPSGSGVDCVVLQGIIGRGVTGDWGPGTWWWMAPASATSTTPTGTGMNVVSGRIGASADNKVQALFTVTVESTDGVRMRPGLSQFENAIGSVGVPYRMVDEIDGAIIVPPGFYVGLSFDGDAGASPLAHIGFTWKEVLV